MEGHRSVQDNHNSKKSTLSIQEFLVKSDFMATDTWLIMKCPMNVDDGPVKDVHLKSTQNVKKCVALVFRVLLISTLN